MSANDEQVGGTHYHTEYQHWDFVLDTGMDYFAAQVTKYVTRWRRKNGEEDLKKALHFLDKLIENWQRVHPPTHRLWGAVDLTRYAQANELSTTEVECILSLSTWRELRDLEEARDCILFLLNPMEPKPVPLSDSNKHAER